MSDANPNNPNNIPSDDEFKSFATQTAQEEQDRKNRGNFSVEYEDIKWTGLKKPQKGVPNTTKVVRALGGVPNTNKTAYDARTVRIATIVCDDKKNRRFILPPYDENKGYIFWRLINAVLEVQWNDKKKTYIHETAHPQIFQMVQNNSFPVGSMQQKTTYGWSGRDMFIMNCLDRAMMEWHRTNKHSALLSKDIRFWKAPDGKDVEFAEQGVPAYGFVQLIASQLFAYYGSWNKYDIGIERTGTMNSPYQVFNCEKNPEKVSPDAQGLVVNGPLTDEELSWEMYDLRKLFGVSSYTKWWNNLKNSIASIDTALGTHFFQELQDLVATEKAEREARRQAEEANKPPEQQTQGNQSVNLNNSNNNQINQTQTTPPPADNTTPPPADTTPPIEQRQAPQAQNNTQVHCVDKLPPELKEQIESYGFDANGKFYITYKSKETAVGCTVCQTPSPKSFTMCPKCGVAF